VVLDTHEELSQVENKNYTTPAMADQIGISVS
ncbi:MAG: hypothetical protein QG577_273, partial [Thermodesulfobacteriota bacterium]|nr:hypothetical protein [Thermodesulfobacteriota bacterium]